jgi:formamidopyrimidine-DNA glycosylase
VPELPDISAYIHALETRVLGQTLEHVRLGSAFVLRTVDPPVSAAEGHAVTALRRIGKRIAIGVDNDVWLVIHLMIAGRLHWKPAGAKLGGRNAILALDFQNGTLLLTEAGSKRRASLHMVRGEQGLREMDPGGIEIFAPDTTLDTFRAALTRENHTLKRGLTDPHLFSGIGNAYSDEILHAAHLSPLKMTRALSGAEVQRLHDATRATLAVWIERLRAETGGGFPETVTAFRAGMAVHGRFRQPCPVCGSPVQHIVYAANECNYCATCQTGGRLLADRALSRLLKSDWPKRLED